MDKTQETKLVYDKVALAYQDKFMDLDLYNDSYNLFCKLLKKPNSSIFEIGCGPGNITKYLLSIRPDYQLQAIDLAPNMIKLAKINNPAAQFKVMDCREIDTLNVQFDGIICGFCMPYLSKEESYKLIKDCSALLTEGGIFYFSTIEGNYNESGYEHSSNGENKVFVHYYQKEYLLTSLKENNFEKTELFEKTYNKSDGSPSTHLIFITRKK